MQACTNQAGLLHGLVVFALCVAEAHASGACCACLGPRLQMPRAADDLAGAGPSNAVAKRARRSGGLAVDEPVGDNLVCKGCGKGDDAEVLFLCDWCNNGYHSSCSVVCSIRAAQLQCSA